jgi:hypothetical protein
MRLIALCFVLAGCGPSCEERGGTMVFTGYYYVMQVAGKFNYMQQYPKYECVIKEKNNGNG